MNIHIISLRNQLIKSHVSLRKAPNNIHTNAFNPKVADMWHANISIQLTFDPYVVATYCTPCMIKVNKIITFEFNTIIHACIAYMNKLKPIMFFLN